MAAGSTVAVRFFSETLSDLKMALKAVTLGLASAFLVSASGFLSLAAYADDTELVVSNIPSELIIGDPKSNSDDLELTIFVESATDKRLVVEFIDFFIDDQGERIRLPAGATPYSLANALVIQPYEDEYTAKGKLQRFQVMLSPKNIDDKLLYTGGVNVRLESLTEESSSAPLSSDSSVLRSLIVSPFGVAGNLAEGNLLAAKITRHDLTRLDRSSLIDSILPDLPGVVNYGAVTSTVFIENPGQYPVFTRLSWEFSAGEQVLASRSFPKAALGPGQEIKRSVNTQIPGQSEGLFLNILPGFGLVSNKISLTSSLGGTDLPTQVFDGSFIVLQWKEPFVGLLALYLVVRWAWRRNLSEQKRRETASLLGLGISGIARGLKRRLSGPAAQSTTPPRAGPPESTSPPARPMYVPPASQYQPRSNPPQS